MNDERTIPCRPSGLPVCSIRVEILSGPNCGSNALVGGDYFTIGTAEGNDLVLVDPTVSRFHLSLERSGGRILIRDHGSTNGTAIGPVLLKDQSAFVTLGTVLQLGETVLKLDDGGMVLVNLHGRDSLGGLRGRTTVMQRLMATIEQIATKEVPVLVTGESGTGKELVARALHDVGLRANQPLVTVDCGGLTQNLFCSELFGHERGAFTGADRRHIGAFERAHRGTLFLDEIGDLPPALQVALLGALERRQIRRVGGHQDIPVDVRLVSATHRDLRREVNAGTFRLDLYYRIAVVVLNVPPLAQRTADIPLLVEHFLRETGYQGEVEAVFPLSVMQELQAHLWPGNVRELRNVVEATIATGSKPQFDTPPIAWPATVRR